jgi:hydroxyacylglutathione hydrolase
METVTRYLVRLGFDNLAGFLGGGMLAWHRAGLESRGIDTVTVQELCHHLDGDSETWVLDVRSLEEVEANPIPGAQHIHIKSFPEQQARVPTDRRVYIFCGSGIRSMIVASLLRRQGWGNLTVVLGGLAGWSSVSCPLPLD